MILCTLSTIFILAVAGYGSDPMPLRKEGLELLKAGKPDLAIPLLNKAKTALPDDMQLRLGLGDAYLDLGKYEQALKDYSEVIIRHPSHLEANLGRARSLIGLGDGPKAVGPARLVVEIAPDRVLGWMVLGDAYSHGSTQDYPRAAQAYQKALQLDPNSLRVAMSLARALNHKKETEQAVRILEQARRHHQNDPELLTKLAESYYVLRKLDRAERLIAQALKANPNNAQAIRVADQIHGRRAYELWVPIIALVAFPLLILLVRWMKKGRVPKL